MKIGFWAELRLAARWAGYTWQEFRQLPANPRWMGPDDEDNQAGVLVMYRLANKLEEMGQSDAWR